MVYDFDGFDLGSSTLPEGDYQYGDLAYSLAADPVSGTHEMLGDRVLKMDLNWSANYGAFGRGITRYLQLAPNTDKLNFYFYNPTSNQQAATFTVTIADDDNNNKTYEAASDDAWKKTVNVPGAGYWQLISLPLSSFTDGNSGGNGTFDIGFSQTQGMLLLVEFRFDKPSPSAPAATFYCDMICFSEGNLPTGSNITDLPPKLSTDYCLLGAHQYEIPGEYYKIPAHFEGNFPAVSGKKIKYVNTYLHWGTNGQAQASNLPGQGYQTLMTNGYRPIITWEPSFDGYSLMDPVQPTLDDIANGVYDTYIDNFANTVKAYTDTIIMRPMHEFDGDWYKWCTVNNNNDPQKYIDAFRHLVNRFNAKGATKVKWMWCPNNDFSPQEYWNWIVSAYPGDQYVDIVGTDVYNAHYPASLPWWRSFRWQTTEVYYYARKYIPNKPFMICELACRERQSSESGTSQSKAGWFAEMDKELQSQFHDTRAIIFFSETKDQTWDIKTSSASVASLKDNIWMDDYYFGPALAPVALEEQRQNQFRIFPNPAADVLYIKTQRPETEVLLMDMQGRTTVVQVQSSNQSLSLKGISPGVYLVKFVNGSTQKLIIDKQE